jgi:uncharacterized protein
MTQPAKSQEPSMEEILASIRRIIADDDASKSPPRGAEPPKPVARPVPAPPPRIVPEPAPVHASVEPAEPPMSMSFDDPDEEESSDILDLTESMATPAFEPPPSNPPQAASAAPTASELPQFRKIDAFSDVAFEDEEAEEESRQESRPEFKPDFKPNLGPEFRPAAARSEPAARPEPETMLLSRETSAAVDSAFNALAQTVLVQNARTLEDLVREMLRPMLKSWLDDNLPGMVERLVRAEIERVARGR